MNGAKILASSRAFTYYFMKLALHLSFTLFRPLSARKKTLFGVFHLSLIVPLWSEYAPRTPRDVRKGKFTVPAKTSAEL